MIQALTDNYFRTATLRSPVARVDARNERIVGAKIIEAGDTNDDRPVTIDLETLAQVIEFGNRPNKGVKARFAHPSMSDDGLGRYLGRWTDFRLSEDGQAVLADLQLSQSSHEAPEGDLGAYVLSLAADEPDMFGVSIVSGPDSEAMDAARAALPEGARVPLRLAHLRAADFVDEPAATRGGLFSMDTDDPRSLAAIAAKILDTHFADSDPEDVLERFARMLARHYGKKVDMANATETLAEPIAAAPVENPAPAETLAIAEAVTEVDTASLAVTSGVELLEACDPDEWLLAFGDRGARWYLEGLSLEECYRRRCAELEQLAIELETRLQAAIASGGGEAEPLSASIALSADELKALRNREQADEDIKKGIPERVSRWSRAFGRG